MTRRQVHAVLLIAGLITAWAALNDAGFIPHWVNRSDTFYVGFLFIALGVHGIWKRDPR